MKQFLKFTLATVCGIIVAGAIFTLIGMVSIFSMLASGSSETNVKKNSIMVLNLNGELQERSNSDNFASVINMVKGSDDDALGLDDILSAIEKAKQNDDIKGIYIKASSLGTSFASLEAIRAALHDFKASGKFIVTYGDNYSQGLYYLCSVADKVIMNPQGTVDWRGLASNITFYKGLLDKLGVEMQIFKVGTYKSAVEPYINTEMSEANREQMNALLNDIWSRILSNISASRGIKSDSLNAYADRTLTFAEADDIVATGMVDTLMYQNDVRDYLKSMVGIEKDDKLALLDLEDMKNVKKSTPKDMSGNILAVYYAVGSIVDTPSNNISSSGDEIVGNKVIKDLRKLKEDEDVKAVVLRVNSPGGSAYASEQIWKAICDLKSEKPVIVSMGDYAASGGYYISCCADSIVAEPTTLTGSIGIFGVVPNTKGLMVDKVGLSFDGVKTNEHSDLGLLTRPMSESEKVLLQAAINRGYELFTGRCADGRNMSKDDIKKIAEGRVWTGTMAREIGLVDVIGGIDKAIEIAAAKADIDSYTLMSYPEQESMLSSIFGGNLSSYVKSSMMKSELGSFYKEFSLIQSLENMPRIQARMPLQIDMR